MNKELKKYIKENLEKKNKANFFFGKFDEKLCGKSISSEVLDDECWDFSLDMKCKNDTNSNLKDYIKENDKYNDFQTTLFKMIDDRKLIDADVYNKVHIDRRLFSKIRNDKTYHPSKETVILLGLSLELSESDIEKLLDSASYSLPRNNYYDLIIRFCFMKGIYKITEVNNLLEEYKCKLFSY